MRIHGALVLDIGVLTLSWTACALSRFSTQSLVLESLEGRPTSSREFTPLKKSRQKSTYGLIHRISRYSLSILGNCKGSEVASPGSEEGLATQRSSAADTIGSLLWRCKRKFERSGRPSDSIEDSSLCSFRASSLEGKSTYSAWFRIFKLCQGNLSPLGHQ